MTEMALWCPIIEAVGSHLNGRLNKPPPEPETVAILIGDDGSIPTAQTLILTRGPVTTTNWVDPWGGAQTIYIQAWTYDQDDPMDAYRSLAALEHSVINAMVGPVPLQGYELLPRITAIEPDNDSFRPSVGSRITVEIEWRKSLL